VPASCSDRALRALHPRRAVALAALASLLACATRDVDVKPFRLEAVLASGVSVADGATGAGTEVVRLTGPARRLGDTELEVADPARGTVTLRFDRSAAPELAFPARLEGAPVVAEIFVMPDQRGPTGAPSPITGFRVATRPEAPTYEFALGESSERFSNGTPAVPLAVLRVFGDEDLPPLETALTTDFRDAEPARCGLVYLASLAIQLADRTAGLARGERVQVAYGSRPEPLTVLHVLSYERHGVCAGQSETWTQIATWR
jgi:hypothetical protein